MNAIRQAKLTRRIILASILVAGSLWYLAGAMAFDKKEFLGFVSASFVLVLGTIVLALLVVVPFKLFQSRRRTTKISKINKLK